MTWWAFDIETARWDQLVTACAVSDDGRALVLDDGTGAEPKFDAVLDWYCGLDPSDVVWAHNGGGFDFILLISIAQKLKWQARMAGSNIVSCRAAGHAQCRDTCRLFPGTLAKWTGRKDEFPLACVCGVRNCKGYCAIRRDLPEADRKRLISYNLQDCRALLDTLREDLQRLEGEGLAVLSPRDGLPRLTFGSIAWHTASELIDDGSAVLDWAGYQAERPCYYGGRCEGGRLWLPPGSAPGKRFDANAMYPWALTLPGPWGTRSGHVGPAASRMFRSGAPGAYRATVRVPESDLPPLPHRYREKKGRERLHYDRLLWCTGTFTTWLTQHELSYGESVGVEIEKVDCAFTWDQFTPRYAPYLESIYAARDRAKIAGDDRWAAILKWFANALSGKLAQRPESSLIVVTDDPQPGWQQVGPPDSRVWSKSVSRISPCSRPIEAAYLTSRSRTKLHERLWRHTGRWLMCDTDSTYTMDYDPIDVDEHRLGAFKYEGEAHDWRMLAPKLYRYRDGDGKEVVRARGIPDPTWDMFEEMLRGEPITRRKGVERLKSGHGRFIAREITRTHKDWDTDRCGTRFVNADGTTRPLHRRRDGQYV